MKAEIFIFAEESVERLLKKIEEFGKEISQDNLKDLSHLLFLKNNQKIKSPENLKVCLVSDSFEDLKNKTEKIKSLLTEGKIPYYGSEGIYISKERKKEKIAFLFPGQGSQFPNMCRGLALSFDEMKESIEKADSILKGRFPKLLSEYIYPPSFSPENENIYMEELTRTNITQPALAVIEMGIFKILRNSGIKPDMMAGHSLGEYVALCASGVFDEEVLYDLVEYRGSAIIKGTEGKAGKMVAVGKKPEEIEDIINSIENVYIANLNSPSQTILSVSDDKVDELIGILKKNKIRCKKINVSCGFHSPFMEGAKKILDEKLIKIDYSPPKIPVYSNLTAERYPEDKNSIFKILSEHLVNPVKFTEEIENMYKDGARIFIEVGPANVLTNLVKQILDGKDFSVIPSNPKGKDDIFSLLNLFAHLITKGIEIDLSPLFKDKKT